MDNKDILAYAQSRVIYLQNQIIHCSRSDAMERANKIAIQELLKLIEMLAEDLRND